MKTARQQRRVALSGILVAASAALVLTGTPGSPTNDDIHADRMAVTSAIPTPTVRGSIEAAPVGGCSTAAQHVSPGNGQPASPCRGQERLPLTSGCAGLVANMWIVYDRYLPADRNLDVWPPQLSLDAAGIGTSTLAGPIHRLSLSWLNHSRRLVGAFTAHDLGWFMLWSPDGTWLRNYGGPEYLDVTLATSDRPTGIVFFCDPNSQVKAIPITGVMDAITSRDRKALVDYRMPTAG